MVELKSIKCSVVVGVYLAMLFSVVSAQSDQEIYFKYCVATPDTECFNPVSGAVDTVGRDVGELGGGYRFCLPVEAVDAGAEPVQIVIAIDKSVSMTWNDPTDMRTLAAHVLVDSLKSKSPESYVGSAIFYQGILIDLSLSPVQLNDQDGYDTLWNSLENGATDPQLRKTLKTLDTYQGEGLTAALDMLLSLRKTVPGMKQHIIMITDDGWYEEEDIKPEEVLAEYRPQFPDGEFPLVHTVVLTESGSPSTDEMEGLANIEMIADSTGGKYIENATPQTIVTTLLEILNDLIELIPNSLEGMSVTNLTNGETRNHTNIQSVQSEDNTIVQFQASIDNLPIEFGPNTIIVKRMVNKAGNDQPVEEFDTVTIFRTDSWTTTVDPEEYTIHCTDDSTSISINVTPPLKFIDQPFDVQSTIVMKEKFLLDSVDVRVFTKFPDTDANSVAVFHLDGNLNNSTANNNGTGSDVTFTTTENLFGNGAVNSGSFTTDIGNLAGDFAFETWIKPTDAGSRTELFKNGDFGFGIDENLNLYVQDGNTPLLQSESSLSLNTWSHIAVSRVSGKIILSINGLSVSDDAEYNGTLSGEAQITCSANAVLDEIRISNSSRLNAEKFSVATRLDIPTVSDITWVLNGNDVTLDVLTLPPGVWNNGTIDFQFKSPVSGKLVVNFQHKGTAVATVWSKNGNPVFAAADLNGPYITRVMITPGPINSSEDKMQVYFSEPVICDSLKKSTEPAESFKVYGFSTGTPVEKNNIFTGGHFTDNACAKERITDVILYVKKESAVNIVALLDSIKLVGSVVDTFGNPPDTTRFGYIESFNTVSINVTPPLLLTNEQFSVQAQLFERNKAPLENIDVRIFTGFPDSDINTIAVFHLENNLNNSSSDNIGTSAGVDYTEDEMLFGDGALSGGSFSTTIGNLTGDFSFEAWIRPSSTTQSTVFFKSGNFEFGINDELKPYVSAGDELLAVSEISLDSTWNHVAVSRLSGSVLLLINGLSVSGFVEYNGTLSGAATITCPENAILDEIRISKTHRLIENPSAATMRFDIPMISNIAWSHNGGVQTQDVLTLNGSDWSNGSLSLKFSSSVGGKLIVNFQDKGATPATIRSVNGNAVYCAADLQGPYITQAIFIPGPINLLEDTVKIHFSEPVICDSLKNNNDLTQVFKVYEFKKDPTTGIVVPVLKDSVFVGAHFESLSCSDERLTDVTLLVRTRNLGGIVPERDSIKLFGSVVDTCNNYPDTTKFGKIMYGPGSGIEIAALPADLHSEPMRVPAGVKERWNIAEDIAKIVVIQTRAQLVPVSTEIIDGKPVENYSHKSLIYDAVGNVVVSDLVIRKTPQSDRMYFMVWNGTNRSKRMVSSGAYLLRTLVTYQNQQDKFVPLQTKFSIKWSRDD